MKMVNNEQIGIMIIILMVIFLILISLFLITSQESSKDSFTKFYPKDKEEIFLNKKYSNISGIIINSLNEYSCEWYPDNSPKNNLKKCVVELQIDDLKTGRNYSLKGTFDVPKYYSGGFDFNTSLESYINIRGLKEMPKITWEYSTESKEIINNYTIGTYEELDKDNFPTIKENVTQVLEEEFLNYKPIDILASSILKNYDLFLDPNVSICGTLSTAGSIYTLNVSVNSSGTCFTISNQNITLDCQGYLINYSQGGTANTYGVYSTQRNSTIKNCIIQDGNYSATVTRYGIYITGATADYPTIYNNTITTNGSSAIYLLTSPDYYNISNNVAGGGTNGFYIQNSLNGTFSNNYGYSTILGTTRYAIIFDASHNATIINNIGNNSNNSYGIAIYRTNNSYLFNNTGYSLTGSGIGIITNSQFNTLINNTGIATSGLASNGILVSQSSYNNLTGNNGTSLTANGIQLFGAFNNNLIGNIANGITGIYILTNSNDNNLINNTGIGGAGGSGLYLRTSDDNILTNNLFTDTTNTAVLLQNATSNTFYKLNATGTGATCSGIYLYSNSQNNTFYDCIDIVSKGGTGYDVKSNTGVNIGNVFTNCTFPRSNENIQSGDTLIRKWFHQTKVEDTDAVALSDVNITFFNNSNNIFYSALTDVSGFINTFEIIDYINNGTRNYYSLYNITTSLLGYYDYSEIYNVTYYLNNLSQLIILEKIPVAEVVISGGGVGGGYTLESPLIEVQLKPHYYINGKEVSSIQNTNNTFEISFDVSATNDGEEITDIIIYDASPIDFKQAFPNTAQTLGTETKLLWTSDIISISNFSEDIGIIFSVVIKGKRNNVNVFGSGKIVIYPKEKKENILMMLGKKIYPEDYKVGILVIFSFLMFIGLLLWKYETYNHIKKALDNWREKQEFKNKKNVVVEDKNGS